MIIEKYGITLTRLKESDIELVRLQRNSSDINSRMQYRETISPAMQKQWFDSINNIYHNYFIASYHNQHIGLVNGKNSDYEKRQSEGGMFIWEKKYWGTVVPAMCSVIMSDFTFLITDFHKSYIKILKSNENAINYNKQIGYLPTEDYASDEETQYYVLTKERYLEKISEIRKGIRTITGDDEPLMIEDISLKDETDEDLDRLYRPLPDYVKQNVNRILTREGRMLL